MQVFESPVTADTQPRIGVRPFYASFNGLRALAISLVFLVHYGGYVVPSALVSDMWVGVDLFFVLSGFLITGILVDAKEAPNFFRTFYTRRALRIFPLFYGFFLVLFLATPVFHIQYRHSLFLYVVYLGNLAMPFFDLSRNNPTVILVPWGTHHFEINIGSFWTLCVEEQFYLVWPAIVWLVRSRKRLMQVCLAGWGLAFVCRLGIVLLFPKLVGFLGWYTYTRMDSLFLGAWFALWMRERPISPRQLRHLARTLTALGLFGYGLARFLPQGRVFQIYAQTLTLTWIDLAAAGLLLWSLDDETRFSAAMRWKPWASFGAVSYGFYFVHALYMQEAATLFAGHPVLRDHAWLIPLAAFSFALVFAKLSFRYYETPFLRLKTRLAPQQSGNEAQGARPALLHVSVPTPET